MTATRGEFGTPDPEAWPPQRLAAERTAELARCLELLGVSEHHWLGYRDGECAAVPAAEAVGRLCEVIDDVAPDTVLTFGPDGITGHPDHQAVSAWATAAFARAAPPRARLLHSAVPARRVPVEGPRRQPQRLRRRLPGRDSRRPAGGRPGAAAATAARKVAALAKAQATQTAGLLAAMGSTATPRGSATSPSSSTSGRRRSPSDRPRGSRAREVPLDGPPRHLEDGVPPGDGDGGPRPGGSGAGRGRARPAPGRRRRAARPAPRRRAGAAGRRGCAASSTGGSSCRCARSSR